MTVIKGEPGGVVRGQLRGDDAQQAGGEAGQGDAQVQLPPGDGHPPARPRPLPDDAAAGVCT